MNRIDFVYLFDVKDGNPNGDPDAGNLPRLDAETGEGLVTDVCLKRKIRNFVGLVKEEQPPFEIYVKEKAVLNRLHERSYADAKLKPVSKKLPKKEEDARRITSWMCQNFFDVRTFGAVMTTEVNAGQVRGPVQLTLSRSVHPIVSQEHAVTRCAVTNEKDLEKERTIGRKFTIPYALYRGHGFFNANLAEKTHFNENGEDLDLLWQAFLQMFDHDRSAARGEMSACKLILFEHDSPLGSAPARKLFDAVSVRLKPEVEKDGRPPRDFSDYEVVIDSDSIPDSITVIEKL
ncbi:Type I-C CRISPR-associated protein Cas7/Csd2 [Planctomycetales bacterium 10988]|nr:Type I-C CRISPR-associated protein Cas7/Csd2 [Planctomycetales bacterium 10988]